MLPHIVEGVDVRGFADVVDQGIGIGSMSVVTCCGYQLIVVGIRKVRGSVNFQGEDRGAREIKSLSPLK